MKLYSDAGNLDTVKILLSARFSCVTLRTDWVKPDHEAVPYVSRKKLPALELSTDQIIFSANAACRYLLAVGNKDSDDIAIDEWLEWECSQLQPTLYACLLTYTSKEKRDGDVVKNVNELLKLLEDALQDRENNLGSTITAVDLVLWPTLYPLFNDNCPPAKDFKPRFPGIAAWFNKLSQEQSFTEVTGDYFDGAPWNNIKTSIHSQPAPASVTTSTQKLLKLKFQSDDNVQNPAPGSSSSPTESGPAVTREELAAAVDSWNYGKEKVPACRQRVHPILPKEGEKNILITSALPYVNNVPHLGNIIGCVLSADVYSRFCRLRNYNVLFVCGTDEYGTATETKAVQEGLTPIQICDKYNKLHTEIYHWFSIDFDYFGRTTTQQQTEIAQDIFWKLHKRGYILKDSVDQLKCELCNRFLADRFVEGTCPLCAYEDARGDQCDKCGKLINAVELIKPRCKVCGNPPVMKTSQHLFMDLPSLEPALVKHLDREFEKGLWSSNTKVITKAWLRDGLKPRCISRDLKWGTPVPLEGYTDKVFYVWYDAPIGYISITANYTKDWEKWWKNPQQVELLNFMAKDNVPFHSVIFPCTLLGTGDNWTVVNHLSATEYLNYEDGKFSKSRGVGVFGNDAQNTGIPTDIWRFYLLYLRPESQDSTFSWDDFVTKNNSELLNNLGNFINRALMFVSNNFNGLITEIILHDEEKELLALITRELKGYIENLEKIRLRDGIRNILSISRLGNQYMQASKPWVLVKGSEEDKSRAGTVIALAANVACLLSVMVHPYMPTVSKTIQQQLNAPQECNVLHDQFVPYLAAGHRIGKPKPLFQKIEPKFAEELKIKFAGKQDAINEQKPPASKTGPTDNGSQAPKSTAGPEEIARLTEEVSKQGIVVRELKTQKAEKAVIDGEVVKLLDLKKQLALAQGVNPQDLVGGKKKKGKK